MTKPLEWPQKATPDLLQALFLKALTLEIGMRIPVMNPDQSTLKKLNKMLYEARSTDPRFDQIQISQVPNDGEWWLIKKSVEVI